MRMRKAACSLTTFTMRRHFEGGVYTAQPLSSAATFRGRRNSTCGDISRKYGRPKHPTKVHVWAGISKRGRTPFVIFDGIMDAEVYTNNILEQSLLPFVQGTFPDRHRFMQDNDPKHTSRHAKQFMEDQVHWWKSPAESPNNLNPIENRWHEMKEFIRREVKPHTKYELVNGIVRFWETVSVDKCRKYTGHLAKVLPRVIELNGDATEY